MITQKCKNITISSLNDSNVFDKGSSKTNLIFYSVNPLSNDFRKNYVNLNKTSTKYPKYKRTHSSLSMCLNHSDIKKRKKKFGLINFSQADRLDIHEKAAKYLDALFERQRTNYFYKEPRYKDKTSQCFIGVNEIKTRILKESNDCFILSSKIDQIKCFGNKELRDIGIRKIQEQISRRKYASVSLSKDHNNTKMLPDQHNIQKEIKKHYLVPRMNFCINNYNNISKNGLEKNKTIMKYRFISNQLIPKVFENKTVYCDKIKTHQLISKKINESIMSNHYLLFCLRENKKIRKYFSMVDIKSV